MSVVQFNVATVGVGIKVIVLADLGFASPHPTGLLDVSLGL